MEIEIEIPDSFFGAVTGHLTKNRAILTETKMSDGMAVIFATVPLAELFDFSNDLRSMTQGKGTFSMTPAGYQPVPAEIEERVLTGRR